MPRLTKLAKLESQIDEVCAASERIALRLSATVLFYVGLFTLVWILAKHLL
jgi:hypothetical protein